MGSAPHASQLDEQEEGLLALVWNVAQVNVTSSVNVEVELNLGSGNETRHWMRNLEKGRG